jgi:hypothetical protein
MSVVPRCQVGVELIDPLASIFLCRSDGLVFAWLVALADYQSARNVLGILCMTAMKIGGNFAKYL